MGVEAVAALGMCSQWHTQGVWDHPRPPSGQWVPKTCLHTAAAQEPSVLMTQAWVWALGGGACLQTVGPALCWASRGSEPGKAEPQGLGQIRPHLEVLL